MNIYFYYKQKPAKNTTHPIPQAHLIFCFKSFFLCSLLALLDFSFILKIFCYIKNLRNSQESAETDNRLCFMMS